MIKGDSFMRTAVLIALLLICSVMARSQDYCCGTAHIGGRVTVSNTDLPFADAAVKLQGSEDLVTFTDKNGFYLFEKVPLLDFCVLTVTYHRYEFQPSYWAFSVLYDRDDVDFEGRLTRR
jgi:hypothetical protein